MATLTNREREELIGYLSEEVATSLKLDFLINSASFRVGRCYFGKAYIYALSLMVMHKAALLDLASEGAAGPITSKREGDLSVSYGNGGGSGNSDLNSTVYGQEYLTLLEQYSPRPGVSGGFNCMGLDGGDIIQNPF